MSICNRIVAADDRPKEKILDGDTREKPPSEVWEHRTAEHKP